jgi:hypothetical protein
VSSWLSLWPDSSRPTRCKCLQCACLSALPRRGLAPFLFFEPGLCGRRIARRRSLFPKVCVATRVPLLELGIRSPNGGEARRASPLVGVGETTNMWTTAARAYGRFRLQSQWRAGSELGPGLAAIAHDATSANAGNCIAPREQLSAVEHVFRVQIELTDAASVPGSALRAIEDRRVSNVTAGASAVDRDRNLERRSDLAPRSGARAHVLPGGAVDDEHTRSDWTCRLGIERCNFTYECRRHVAGGSRLLRCEHRSSDAVHDSSRTRKEKRP